MFVILAPTVASNNDYPFVHNLPQINVRQYKGKTSNLTMGLC